MRKIAGDEWLPIDPADLKMTSEPKAPGAPAIYLYRQVDRKDLGRANTEHNWVRIKIFKEEGRESANVVIPYLSDNSSISNIGARTIHADGSIVNFDGKVFDKMVEKTKGLKFKAKVFTVPDVQVGSIVEYHFNYDFQGGYVFNSYGQSAMICSRGRLCSPWFRTRSLESAGSGPPGCQRVRNLPRLDPTRLFA
jgi:hypothetical protein